jgi:predicted glycosyltransferase
MPTAITNPVQTKRVHEGPFAGSKRSSRSASKRIWIDLDNSPHVPFFLPIIEGLERRGYQVLLTARDSYQVCELLNLHQLSCRVIGRHYGKKWILKLLGTLLRAAQLLPLAAKARPDLAVSHTSRAQFLAASVLRIPTVIMFDYEFANTTGFLRPDWLFVPEMISERSVSQTPGHLFRYRGLKEDVYVPRFKPDPNVRTILGIHQDELAVTVRPPATEAPYHNPEGEEFFAACLQFLLRQPTVRVVVLPRNEKQSKLICSNWSRAIDEKRIIIPEHALDGLNLIWNSDLVISGGGTMNREAAALGVPVYSIFRGRTGAVDEYLAKTGRLTFIRTIEDIHTKIVLKRRTAPRWNSETSSASLDCILEAIISVAETKCLPARS